MVYVTGDCHGAFSKFNTSRFPDQKEMTKDDFVIICGDFGLWHDCAQERYWLNWLNDKPFTTLFVDGNHENFDRLYSNEFPVVDFHGGKAHQICPSVYHLMRGHVFDICGKKFFAFGGASSHDIADGILDEADFDSHETFKRALFLANLTRKQIRVNHRSWWHEELPSLEEMEFGKARLKDVGNKVDFIISHCLPQTIASIFSHGLYKPDRLTLYFNEFISTVKFDHWYCGHYHIDDEIMSKYTMLYDDIVRIV